MAESLGEKLRLAREARGITLSEVSAQTRIATRYLEAIEENNYKPLPGGVFNKGFIKAYAKYVGVDEQEALNDYARLLATQTASEDDDDRYRRPMVLTDDRNRSSASSLIFAVIILVLMTGGILLLVQWYRSAPPEQAKIPPRPTPANSSADTNANNSTASEVPLSDQLKVELRSMVGAGGEPPFVSTKVDDEKPVDKGIRADEPRILNPKNVVKISYSKSQAGNLQLILNGKPITLPGQPLKPSDSVIKFEINKDNAAQILQSGQITLGEGPPVSDTNTAGNNVAAATTPKPTPKATATPAKTPTPAANVAGVTAVRTPAPKPVLAPTVITPRKPN